MDALADIVDLFSNNDVNPGSGSGGVSSFQVFNPNDYDFYQKIPLEPYRIFNVAEEVRDRRPLKE
jgi:hypothetical protein